MQTNFREHLLGGLFGGAAFSYALFTYYGLAPISILPHSLLFLLSALLPDIDSKKSKPRRYLRALAFASFAVISILYFPQLSALHSLLPFVFPFLCFIAVEAIIPGHRGILHSPLAAITWAVLLFFLTNSPNAALAAFLGYSTHLLIDFLGDRL